MSGILPQAPSAKTVMARTTPVNASDREKDRLFQSEKEAYDARISDSVKWTGKTKENVKCFDLFSQYSFLLA